MSVSRRKFISLSVGILPTIEALRRLEYQQPAKDELVVAVLENTNSKTMEMTGAEIMLKRAGFKVIRLTPEPIANDLSVSAMVMNYEEKGQADVIRERIENPRYAFTVGPDIKKVDMLFFGTFTNIDQRYQDYMRRYAKQIPAFVQAGGIVMEMCQWGRYSFLHPDYFPDGMKVVRETWSGTDELILTDREHPLISKWLNKGGNILEYPKQMHQPGRSYDGRRSWESIAEWEGMRLLVGAGGGYRKTKEIPGRAALVEGQHGRGRYLSSSMWLDKLFDKNGESQVASETMQTAETFFSSLYEYALEVKKGKADKSQPTAMAPEPLIGPALGHIDHEQAIIWIRGNKAGSYTLIIWNEGQDNSQATSMHEQALADNDYCIKWHLTGLKANTRYSYKIESGQSPLFEATVFGFHTFPEPDAPATTTLAFGSCVDMNGRFTELWHQIEKHGADGMVLLGDTPYIDSTVLVQQRIKHRTFFSQSGPSYLSKKIPFWGTWDDHDFGANDSDGEIHNRQNTRKVFKEYRSLLYYGEMNEGAYTHFRRGPIEVFLLDTRYFAGPKPSFVSPDKPTLIGQRQWEWLQRVLKASTAPFKILACGMTWDAKLPVTTTHADSWDSYAYEREAIIDFIGKEKIRGVLLIGGDIHCSQVMKYATEDRIGYPLYHIVTSPMHERVIRENEDLKHPGLLFARAEPNTFLKITVNTEVEPWILTADIINITGQSIYRLVIGDE